MKATLQLHWCSASDSIIQLSIADCAEHLVCIPNNDYPLHNTLYAEVSCLVASLYQIKEFARFAKYVIGIQIKQKIEMNLVMKMAIS